MQEGCRRAIGGVHAVAIGGDERMCPSRSHGRWDWKDTDIGVLPEANGGGAAADAEAGGPAGHDVAAVRFTTEELNILFSKNNL